MQPQSTSRLTSAHSPMTHRPESPGMRLRPARVPERDRLSAPAVRAADAALTNGDPPPLMLWGEE